MTRFLVGVLGTALLPVATLGLAVALGHQTSRSRWRALKTYGSSHFGLTTNYSRLKQ